MYFGCIYRIDFAIPNKSYKYNYDPNPDIKIEPIKVT